MADRDIPPIVAPNNSDSAKIDARTEASKYRAPANGMKVETQPLPDGHFEKQATSGEFKRRKKNVFQRIINEFIEEDAASVKEYLIYDVAIPKLKDLIFDAFSGALGRSLYGGRRPPSNVSRYGSSSYPTPYTTYSSSKYSQGSPSIQSNISPKRLLPSKATMDDITFTDREVAERRLNELLEIYNEYGRARVSDLYDILDTTSDYTDLHFGWIRGINGLETAYTDRIRGGEWKLFLPPIRPID